MKFCKEAFVAFKRRVERCFLFGSHDDHLIIPEASTHQTMTSSPELIQLPPLPQPPQPCSAIVFDAESGTGLTVERRHRNNIDHQVPPPPDDDEVKVDHALQIQQKNLDWPLVLIGFCLASAVDIALHSIQTHARIPVCLQLLSFSILLAFTSLFVARFVTFHDKSVPQVLEKSGMFFAVTAFFIALTTSFHLFLKLVSWSIYAISLLTIIVYQQP